MGTEQEEGVKKNGNDDNDDSDAVDDNDGGGNDDKCEDNGEDDKNCECDDNECVLFSDDKKRGSKNLSPGTETGMAVRRG